MKFQNTLNNLKSNSNWQVLKTYLIEMKIKYPSEYFICTELSNAYHMLGMYKESEQASMEAMQLEPNDVLVMYNYAVALYSNEKYLKAIVQLNSLAQRRRGVYSDFTKKQVKRKEQYIINELNNKVVK